MLTARKRGRPTTESLVQKVTEESNEKSRHKCPYCYRNFPRSKSVKSHISIHTGERPYECTFPGCNKSFKQSGQLKTHCLRHTGEKPFICPESGCTVRYAHINRHCKKHPDVKLVRDINETDIRIPQNWDSQKKEWITWYIQNKKVPPAKRRRFSETSDRSTSPSLNESYSSSFSSIPSPPSSSSSSVSSENSALVMNILVDNRQLEEKESLKDCMQSEKLLTFDETAPQKNVTEASQTSTNGGNCNLNEKIQHSSEPKDFTLKNSVDQKENYAMDSKNQGNDSNNLDSKDVQEGANALLFLAFHSQRIWF